MAPTAYLDHAASTPLRPEVLAAMTPHLAGPGANPSGMHRAARAAKTALEEAREQIAAVLGCAVGEVVITGGGTEADNLAVLGAGRVVGPGHGVVAPAFEHKAVLAARDRLVADGLVAHDVRVGPDGVVDLDHLAGCLDDRTAVVSVMLVNNEVGTVQPLREIAALVRDRAPQARLHTDAVQATPWCDVAELAADADLVAVSAHKCGGPKGVGALVVRDGVVLDPLLIGGGQERGLRAGTVDVAGAVGLATALRITAEQRDAEIERISRLRDRLAAGLAAVGDVTVNGDRTRAVAGNLHVRIAGVESETLLVALDRAGVYAAAGSSCASGATEPSHVLLAMGMDRVAARESVRFSLGFASTDADVDHALAVVPETVARLRAASAAA
ncbi:MAG: cysteine desulfurase family protein [Actinomycetes bacterium]